MKKQYLLDTKDLRSLHKMIVLADRAIMEIIKIKEIQTEKSLDLGPAQTDLIEAQWFTRNQLDFFEQHPQSIEK